MTTPLLLLLLSAAPAAPMREVRLAPARVVMDYLGYDAEKDRVWAPGGNTGKVFVVDAATNEVHGVEGFATREQDGRLFGPSSVTFGPTAAYVGNRADASICAVDRTTLRRGACLTLPEAPDGLAYVEATGEVWATTPRSSSLTLISTTNGGLRAAGRIELPGRPEGYAVDEKAGRFFTNLEDKDRTLAVDVKSHRVVRNWPAQCGGDGPGGSHSSQAASSSSSPAPTRCRRSHSTRRLPYGAIASRRGPGWTTSMWAADRSSLQPRARPSVSSGPAFFPMGSCGRSRACPPRRAFGWWW